MSFSSSAYNKAKTVSAEVLKSERGSKPRE